MASARSISGLFGSFSIGDRGCLFRFGMAEELSWKSVSAATDWTFVGEAVGQPTGFGRCFSWRATLPQRHAACWSAARQSRAAVHYLPLDVNGGTYGAGELSGADYRFCARNGISYSDCASFIDYLNCKTTNPRECP
jgi:hypothetical protein